MNRSDLRRDGYMLHGRANKRGYDWWWHNFTAVDEESGEEKPFFIEFYVINPKLSPNKVILGQDPKAKAAGLRPSYAMLNVGTWGKDKAQLHRYFPISECHFDRKKEDVHFGDCQCSETALKGHVEVTPEEAKQPGYLCDAGSLSFDLHVHKLIPFNVGYGAAPFFRYLNAFEMFWHAEGMESTYEGSLTYNGRKYRAIPEKSYGYADKNWGGDYTSPWVWFSSCDLLDNRTQKKLENSVFDIGGGRPKAFGIALNRRLLVDIVIEGEEYEYNFSKFWKKSHIDFRCEEKENEIVWHIEGKNAKSRFVFEGHCPKEGMLWINYEAPSGLKRHNRLWNGGYGYGCLKLYDKKGVLTHDLSFSHGGCEYGEYDN
jgi:tocopherol cyclase